MPQIRNFVGSPRRLRNQTYISETRRPPQPWVVRFSQSVDRGKPYYFNVITNESQWEFPDDSIELSQYTQPPPPPPPSAPALSISQLSMSDSSNQPLSQPLLMQPNTVIEPLCDGGSCMPIPPHIPPPSIEEVIERLSLSEPPAAILREIKAISKNKLSDKERNDVNIIMIFLSSLEIFDNIKHIIEQKFPELDQDIINDVYNDSKIEYVSFLRNNKRVSDQHAKSVFLGLMIDNINKRRKRAIETHNILLAYMLAQQRHFQSPTGNKSANSDLSSDLLTLTSRVQETIFEQNSKNFTKQHLRFPRYKTSGEEDNPLIPRYKTIAEEENPVLPKYINVTDKNKLNKYFYLNDKLRQQLLVIEDLTSEWSNNESHSIQLQIFDEFYRLTQLKLNANDLERLIIESVSHIIRNSSLTREQMINFMRVFGKTINDKNNFTYFQKVANDFFK